MSIKKVTVVAALLFFTATSANAMNQKYFDKLDANGNKTLSKEELIVNLQNHFTKKGITDPVEQQKILDNSFSRKDADGDGKISFEEMNIKSKK